MLPFPFLEAAYMAKMSGGKKVIQPLSVTANGSYEAPEGVDGYNPVKVAVPTEAITEGLSVTSNGTYTPSVGVDGFNLVEVSVDDRYDDGYADGEAAVRAKIQSKEIDTNGTYYAAKDGLDGFDPVKVNVPDRYDEGYRDGYQDGYNNGFDAGVEYAGGSLSPESKEYLLCVRILVDTNPWYPDSGVCDVRLFRKEDGVWVEKEQQNCYAGPGGASSSYELQLISVKLLQTTYGEASVTLKGWDKAHENVWENAVALNSANYYRYNAQNCIITNTLPT